MRLITNQPDSINTHSSYDLYETRWAEVTVLDLALVG